MDGLKVKVEITDSDIFKDFVALYKELLEDSRLSKEVKEEHEKKLSDFMEKHQYEIDDSMFIVDKVDFANL